jgi:hypothetical protein
MLNSQMRDLLYECDTLTVGGIKPVQVKLWKKDSISMQLNGDELQYRLPLKIWMRFSFTLGALGMSHTEHQDVELEAVLKFSSRIFVKNNWKIVTMTRSEGYEWLSDPVVKIRFITIPITPVADFILARQKDALGTLVDNTINNMLDIKEILLPMWTRIQQPIQLSASPQSWLRLSPHNVFMTQLEGRDGEIRGSIGIETTAETFIGDMPQIAIKDSLPEFIVPGRVDSAFIINLYSEISFDKATAITKSYLMGRSFKSGRKELIIQDISITGIGGSPAICLDFTGSYRGRIYAVGSMKYDEASSTISIEDLDFDIAAKKKLHSAAAAFLHGMIESNIKPHLRYPLKERLLESQLMIQKMLCNREIAKNIFVSGEIDSLNIGAVMLTDKAIRAVILARGSLNLEINN